MSVPGHPVPPESYSRELDNEVAREEKPYGYVDAPPPAGTDDYDTKAKEQTYTKKKSY